MEYNLILNGEYTYPLISPNIFRAEGDCYLTIGADDFAEVKQRFSDIKNIAVMHGNTILSESSKYTKYSGIALGTECYDPDIGSYISTFAITLQAPDLATQVSDIAKKLNTGIDYNEATLAEFKNYRITQSKNALSEFLDTHPLLSTAHNNTAAYYSVTKEKQDLMTQQYLSYQIAKAVDPEHAVLTYNATGEVCEPWLETEFLQLIMEVKAYVYPLVSYQQTVEKMIMECTTKDEVSEIVIDYDSAFSHAEPGISEEV